MRLSRLALAYAARRPLATLLVVLLLAAGTAIAALTLLVAREVEARLTRDARGIDLVVGAKGSPLQLVLAGVYHVDVPPGNIPLSAVSDLRRHPMVASAIPLALGDSYRGHRIVGTEPALVEHYGGRLAAGALWSAPMEAVLGSEAARESGLGVGATFVGSHGLSESGGDHAQAPYRVVGVLQPSGTVMDRMVLTSIESVWEVHEAHGAGADHARPAPSEAPPSDGQRLGGAAAHARGATAHPVDGHRLAADAGTGHADHAQHSRDDRRQDSHRHHDHHRDDPHRKGDVTGGVAGTRATGGATDEAASGASHAEDPREVTMALVRYASPLAAAGLAREINTTTSLVAASPALETARLMTVFGLGLDVLRGFAWLLIGASTLMLFVALAQALDERRYDLAILRALGAHRGQVAFVLLAESSLLAATGAVAGLVLAHVAAIAIGALVPAAAPLAVAARTFHADQALVAGIALAAGILAAGWPAWQAYRLDVAAALADN